MHIFVISALLLSTFMVAYRALVGPTVYDRILAANLFGSLVVAIIVAIAFLHDDMMFIDIAMVYALINFVGTIALLKYFKLGKLDRERD